MKQNRSYGCAGSEEESQLLKSVELKIEGEEKPVPFFYQMKQNGSSGSAGRELLKSLELKIEVLEESHNSSPREDNCSSGSASRDEESKLLKSLELKIEAKSAHNSSSREDIYMSVPRVYRIPGPIRVLNCNAYTPGVVSIGPLHRGTEKLKAMEVVKLRYMNSLFRRSQNSEAARKDCVRAMLELEPLARKFYEEEEVAGTDKVELAEMMLIDGCFIVELLYKSYQQQTGKDFILANDYMSTVVKTDLLLFENQIPFLVLQKLFDFVFVDAIPLTRLVFDFFVGAIRPQEDGKEIKQNKSGDHILSILRNCYKPVEEEEEAEEEEEKRSWHYCRYSATQLDLAGVKLVPGSNENLFQVKFISGAAGATHFLDLFRRAHFEIPPLHIYDATEVFLRNAIAFEQCCRDAALAFTSYAFLMDKLINSKYDVELLEKKRILYSDLGSPQEVCRLFNNITKNCVMGDFYFPSCKKMDKYCRKPWPKFLVKLRRDYFGSPWAGISVVAAFILFGLTLIQTIYTMRS